MTISADDFLRRFLLHTRPPAEWLCPMCAAPMIIIEKLSAQQIRLRSAERDSFMDTS